MMFLICFLMITGASLAGESVFCPSPSTWQEAQKCCSDKGQQLPELSTRDDIRTLIGRLNGHGWTSTWLGIQRVRYPEWTWIDTSVYKGIYNSRPEERCAFYNITNQDIFPAPCWKNDIGHLCQTDCTSCETLAVHSHGCFYDSGICYLYFCDGKNWPGSRASCRMQQWDIAVIKSSRLQQAIAKTQFTCEAYWVGLRKEDWVHKDTDKHTIAVWDETEPSERGDCSVFLKTRNDYHIRAETCNRSISTLCTKDLSGRTTPRRWNNASSTVTETPSYRSTDTPNSGRAKTIQIVIGVVCVLFLLCLILTVGLWIYRKRKHKNRESRRIEEYQNEAKNRESRCIEEYQNEATIPLMPLSGPQQVNKKKLRKTIAKNISRLYGNMELWSWVDEKAEVPLDDIYIDLYTERKDQLSHEREPLPYYMDMFQTSRGTKAQRVVLYGEAGTGKTTLVKRIIRDWSLMVLKKNGKLLTKSNTLKLKRFKYVIPIFLRRVKADATLWESMSDQLNLSDAETKTLRNVIQESPEDCLILFDGYDEFREQVSPDIARLIKGEILEHLNIVVTTRGPLSMQIRDSKIPPDVNVFLEGFTTDGVGNYIKAFFSFNDQVKPGDLVEEIKQSEYLESLSRFPAILLLMCVLWRETETLASNVTDFYIEFLRYACVRFERKYKYSEKQTQSNVILIKYNAEIMEIASIAVGGLKGDSLQLDFALQDVKDKISEVAFRLGFFTTEKDKREKEQMLSFHHKLIQEFFAAFYISNCGESEKRDLLIHFYKSPNPLRDSKMFTKFISGLGNQETVNQISALVEGDVEDATRITTDLQLQYLSERQDTSLKLPRTIDLSIDNRHSKDVYRRFMSLDACDVDIIQLEINSTHELIYLKDLDAPKLTTLKFELRGHRPDTDEMNERDLSAVLPSFQNLVVLECVSWVGQSPNSDPHLATFYKNVHNCSCLRRIRLDNTPMGAKMLQTIIIALKTFNILEELRLDGCRIPGDTDMLSLLQSLSTLRLSVLSLSENSAGEQSLTFMTGMLLNMSEMRELCLWDQTSHSRAISSFIDTMGHLAAVESIDISKIETSLSLYGNLAKTVNSLSCLKRIRLFNFRIALSENAHETTDNMLKYVSTILLEGATLGDRDIDWLVCQISLWPRIESFSVVSCTCKGDTKWGSLFDRITKLTALVEMHLNKIDMTPADLRELASTMPYLTSLQSFTLQHCLVADKEAYADLFVSLTSLKDLSTLRLDNSSLTSGCVAVLVSNLPKIARLSHLSVSQCNISEPKGATQLIRAIWACRSLEFINFEGNPLGDTVVKELISVLPELPKIQMVSLRDCSLRDKNIAVELMKTIKSCSEKIFLNLSKNYFYDRYNTFLAIDAVARENAVRAQVDLYG